VGALVPKRRIMAAISTVGALVAFAALPALSHAAPGDISTVSGTGTAGFSGDGGPATSAQLNEPHAVAVDSSGNRYIADTLNNRARKVDGSGAITTVAGTGTEGFSGDGGPATSAELGYPNGVAVDDAGNLYIADLSNNRVRKVDGSGTITTVAGTGAQDFSGDGGPATSAEIAGPNGVAVDDAGNVYIADTSNHRVRKVDASGTISTVAGTGSADFSGDGGPATSAKINSPSALALDDTGNLYIADQGNNRVRKVDSSGTITTVVGNGGGGFSGDGGPATSAELANPLGVEVDGSGNLYIGDFYNHRVRKVNSSGTITTVAGTGTAGFSGDGGPATSAEQNYPRGVAVDGSGNLFVADTGNQRVRKVDPDTVPPETTITSGPSGATNDPTPTFTFSSSEPGSAFECKLDSGSYATCSSPKTTAHLADGSHTFSVRATDPAGNVDPTPASRTFTLDTADVSRSGSTLTITSATGAKDNLVITKPSASTLRVTDLASGPYTGSGIHTGAGCTRSGDSTANCNASGVTQINVLAADQADQVVNSTAIASALNGGTATDTLTGGSAADTLTGGAGADVLGGMGGNDQLLARDLTSDQTIDCGAGSADKADLDLLPKDANSAVTGCETKARH
jgi:sugar lactone lactonase YvrE